MNYTETNQLLLDLYDKPELSDVEKLSLYKDYLYNLRKLAYNGNSDAQYDLAQHYENYTILGNPNPKFNNAKRLYWYEKAALNNHSSAYNNLANLTERGDGCEKDLNLALRYYKKSMELGDPLGKANYKKMVKDMSAGGIYYDEFH